jgi:hypothetical protein
MYELELTNDTVYGGYGEQTYKVKDYDGDETKLEEFVKELNEKSNFWVSWRIINKKLGILEKEIDPLD